MMRVLLVDGSVEVALSSGRSHRFGLADRQISGDSAFAACLPIAAALGEDLELPSASGPLVNRCNEILGIYESWDWGRRVRVDVMTEIPARRPAPGVGLFFSAGVDSTYSALLHPEVTHLIHVIGFEMGPLENPQLRAAVLNHVRRAAETLDRELILLETDVRSFSNSYLNWQRYHGAALAFVAHSLKDVIGTVLIPSSHSTHDFSWGSHPKLDYLWSTDDLQVVHDAADTQRTEKIRRVAQLPGALEWLRVCWVNPGGVLNCGRCPKCLRTMVSLEALGVHAPTFPPLDLSLLAKERFRTGGGMSLALENLDLLETSDRPDLLKVMRRAIWKSRYIPSLKDLARPAYQKVRRLVG